MAACRTGAGVPGSSGNGHTDRIQKFVSSSLMHAYELPAVSGEAPLADVRRILREVLKAGVFFCKTKLKLKLTHRQVAYLIVSSSSLAAPYLWSLTFDARVANMRQVFDLLVRFCF